MKVLGRRDGTPVDLVVNAKPAPKVNPADPTGLMGLMTPVVLEGGVFGSDPGAGALPTVEQEPDPPAAGSPAEPAPEPAPRVRPGPKVGWDRK